MRRWFGVALALFLLAAMAGAQSEGKAEDAVLVVRCGSWYSDKKCAEIAAKLESEKPAKAGVRPAWQRVLSPIPPLTGKGGKFAHVDSSGITKEQQKEHYSLKELGKLRAAGVEIIVLRKNESIQRP